MQSVSETVDGRVITQGAKTPLVSVIVPVFNDQAGVERCLDAVAQQSYPLDQIEVIVVDNGSTPPLSVTRQYPFAAHVVRCETPGSYAARNAGARMATGKVFTFTDADCWADKDWLANGIRALEQSSGRGVIGGEVTFATPTRPSAVALYQCICGFGQAANAREKFFSATANLFCTATQFQRAGPFDERLLSAGDREWCWRTVQAGAQVIHEPQAIVYTHPRTTLRGAIRQARRVVAGRRQLRANGLAHLGAAPVAKRRSAWRAAVWILRNGDLSYWTRVRVLVVATIIRTAAALETLRLSLGARAERR